MKMFLLKILVVVAVLTAVLCIIAAFAPKKYIIKREITINKPAETVYEYLRFLGHQKEFNQWLQYDPNTKIELKGNADGQEGLFSLLKASTKNVEQANLKMFVSLKTNK